MTVWPAMVLILLMCTGRVLTLLGEEQTPSGRVADVVILAFCWYALLGLRR